MVKEMPNKSKPSKSDLVDDLFQEVQEEVNEETVKAAKLKIKELLQQKIQAEKVVSNINRQIEDLKLKIAAELS